MQAEKSVTYLLLYFACLRAGLVFHPLNPAYTPAELAFFLENAAPGMFVGDPLGSEALALAARRDVGAICVHGDGTNAVAIARAVRDALASAGRLRGAP